MKFQVSLIGFICLGVLSVGVFANNLEQYDDQKLRGIIDGMINTTINNILSNLNESIEVPILTLNLNQSLLSGSANIVNFNLTGIKELVATQINVSILSLAMNASIKIPLIQLDTAYNASFILAKFFPLFGDGAVNATINDIDVLVGGKVNLTGGLSLSKVTVSFGIQTAQFSVSGLLGDDELSEMVTTFLNDYVVFIINDQRTLISELISPIAEELINAILKGSSTTQLSVDKEEFYETESNSV